MGTEARELGVASMLEVRSDWLAQEPDDGLKHSLFSAVALAAPGKRLHRSSSQSREILRCPRKQSVV